MSREIKFRAWDNKRRIIVGNDLLFAFANCALYYQRDKVIELRDGLQNPYLADRNNELEMDLIYLQYTGLKDKNGKEIYEGDLIKFINLMPIEAKEEIAEVKFVLEDNFLPYIYPFVNISSYNYETKHFEGFGVNSKDCEVIGNIYENSELLNKREKNNVR